MTDELETDDVTFPKQVEGGDYDSALLIGVIEGQPEYYYVPFHALCKPQRITQREGEDVRLGDFSQLKLDDDETPGTHILTTEEQYADYDELTPFGEFMKAVARNRGVAGNITDKQALVYGLRELVDVYLPRQRVASWLDLSPNTIDNTLATAKEKVEAAQEIANAVGNDPAQ